MKRTKLSVLLAFFASLALAVFLAAQQPATTDPSSSQPAAQSQPASSQQAQPAQSNSSDQQSSAQSSDQSAQDQSASPSDTDTKMPKTASDLPLVALLGVASLGVGFAAHRYSRRYDEH